MIDFFLSRIREPVAQFSGMTPHFKRRVYWRTRKGQSLKSEAIESMAKTHAQRYAAANVNVHRNEGARESRN